MPLLSLGINVTQPRARFSLLSCDAEVSSRKCLNSFSASLISRFTLGPHNKYDPRLEFIAVKRLLPKRQLDTTCSDILACSERPEKRLRIDLEVRSPHVDDISLQCENRDLEMTNLEILPYHTKTDPWPTVVYASYTFMADEPMPEVEPLVTSESPASWTEQRHIEYLGTLVPRLKAPCHYFTGQPGELTEFYRQFKWREETRSWYLNVAAEGWMTDTEWKRVYEDPIGEMDFGVGVPPLKHRVSLRIAALAEFGILGRRRKPP
ncbi:hypothetical protein C8R44DRAFT_736287 [Mycena epipterygia]|nr:hypothetical protein C8R44DRAFT_736287 [Mycena epipterygia]